MADRKLDAQRAPFVPFVGSGFSRDALAAPSPKCIRPEGLSYKITRHPMKSPVGSGFSRDALSPISPKGIMPEGISYKITSHFVGASATA